MCPGYPGWICLEPNTRRAVVATVRGGGGGGREGAEGTDRFDGRRTHEVPKERRWGGGAEAAPRLGYASQAEG
jgi:hypothetical protein